MLKRTLCLTLALILLLLSATACAFRKKEAEPTTEPATVPTTEPTTEPTTIPTTEPTTVPTEPPVILHSGLREDGTFDEGTLFIGDSLTFLFVTHQLKKFDLIGDAKYMCKAGSQITVFFDGKTLLRSGEELQCLYSPEFKNMLFNEAAASMGETATAIYIMWGTNFTPSATYENYVEIVDFLLENCPNATVHLQTVSQTKLNTVPYEKVNVRILEAYDYYQQKGEERVMLIDTCEAIGLNLIPDGVHHNDQGRANWYQAILDHAAANNLPQ